MLFPGTRLGTYEILAPLGAGAMGEVYRARDMRLWRDVAVKVLPKEVASDPNCLARLEREARTVAGLNHPNIVTLLSMEDEDGFRFLTMELVEGQTLARIVTPTGLPLPRILDLSIPIADALVAAHERGIVHRDLKPGNVMVTRDGRVKVLDFGLAKGAPRQDPAIADASTVTADASITGEGQIMGTVPYMAPEQVRGEAVDARTDLFALGIVLYELATGRRPFTGATSADIGSSILRDTAQPLQSIRTDLPGDLDRIVVRCLEKNPRDRTQTALDVFNELRRIRQTLERTQPSATELSAPAQGVPSIAVLPFVNRSRDEEDEYFSDGLADELLNVLAKVRGLRVAARSSSFLFKGKKEDLAVIGQKLNVATVLEGSVRKASNRVRIAVQLVKVSDGYHLWSETYDRTLKDIFAVQDDIAQSVVRELRTTLLGDERGSKAREEVGVGVVAAAKSRGHNAEAHRLVLYARHFLNRLTREDTTKGIAYLRDALVVDPGYALAWAELGSAYGREAGYGWVPVGEGYARSRQAVERALALEPNLAEGHASLAWIQMVHDYDWRGAEASFGRALQLAPGSATMIRGAAALARTLGRFDEAIRLTRRAVDQDPLSAAAYNNLGFAYHAAGRLTEAEAACRKALELAPQRVATRSFLALALLDQGRSEEALTEAGLEPHEEYRLWTLTMIHHVAGRKAQSDAALRELTVKYAGHSACQIAEAHAVRGEVDAAFDWLERAHEQRGTGLSGMKSIPRFRSLHGDPRWATFLRRMGLGSDVVDARIDADEARDERAAKRSSPAPAISSIAVLPFVNMSRDEEDEYFSDGLAEELLNMLAKIGGLRVAARSSSFTFRGNKVPIADVGHALSVAAVLQGSAHKTGNRVRISVRLVRVSDGDHRWSETYDRAFEDIFAVQDDIVQSVAREMRTTLTGEEASSKTEAQVEVARASRGRGNNPEAHRLYLQARYFLSQYTRPGAARGIAHLKEALALDPGYARAWAGLCSAYSLEADWGWAPVEEGFRLARGAVDRALSLDPDLPEGHAEMGWIQMLADRDWEAAAASFRRALELAPGHAPVLEAAGVLAFCQGRLDEAVELHRQALERDPLSSSAYSNLGHVLLAMDLLGEAEEASRKAVEFAPQRIGARANLAMVLLAQGRGEEALDEAGHEPHEGYRLWALVLAFHALGRPTESDAALDELLRRGLEIRPTQIAQIHAARREADRAFECLDRAYSQRDSELTYIKCDRQFRPLHSDPRWPVFMKKMGLER